MKETVIGESRPGFIHPRHGYIMYYIVSSVNSVKPSIQLHDGFIIGLIYNLF